MVYSLWCSLGKWDTIYMSNRQHGAVASSALTLFTCWHVCTRTLIWRRYICKLSTAWGTLEVFNELVIASTRAPPRHVAPFVAILLKAKRPSYPTRSAIRYSKHRRSNECNVDLRDWPYSPGHVATRRKRVMRKSALAVTSDVMSELQEGTCSLQCCYQLMKSLRCSISSPELQIHLSVLPWLRACALIWNASAPYTCIQLTPYI